MCMSVHSCVCVSVRVHVHACECACICVSVRVCARINWPWWHDMDPI